MNKPMKLGPAVPALANRFLDSESFDATSYPRSWPIKSILVSGQPGVVGGPKKSMKTSFVIDMGISLWTATPFLGRFKVPQRVRTAVLSGESGGASVQETARRICKARGVRLGKCRVLWSFHLPRLGSRIDMASLQGFLREEMVECVFIDPLYLCLLSGGKPASASNLFEIGPVLHRVGQACLDAGATPVPVHHSTKTGGKKAEQMVPLVSTTSPSLASANTRVSGCCCRGGSGTNLGRATTRCS
jgi:replicative DNA helicase